ncbi:MAG: YggS family pyridoxal phosphate-dependent enzyme [Gammaproteobacteria bacterium]|nr:YggS family pyridoxal phosphate-dependent enzyme [Gammaproteobacteria bacterium]
MNHITQHLAVVRTRITQAEQRFGRTPGSVRLLAVSKSHPAAAIRAAYGANQICFGESYAQEALTKMSAVTDLPLEWHFIGPIQSNKTRDIAAHFAWVQSVERAKIAQRLNEQRPATLPPLNVCIQVNVSGEASKSGAVPTEVAALAHTIGALPQLRLRGLMAIPAPQRDFEMQRAGFRVLHGLYAALLQNGYKLDTLSMGMTDDLEAAIAEGATLVRVGTAIFGERAM